MIARRRFLAPEVVQTSAMDCGPATLRCLLGGFGIEVGYDRLREACQTDVDGTSIDTMEELACQLGLDAEQIMIPPDHLLVPEARALPAILVTANALGVTHFVVVWRHHGPWLQVMDPGSGRRWVRRSHLFEELYRHRMAVPAAGWREWAGSGEFLDVLAARMTALRFDDTTRRELVERLLADPGWRTAGALDAAVRMTSEVVRSGGLPAGQPAQALALSVLDEQLDGGGDDAIPEVYWSVREAEPDAEGTPRLILHGAVLVRAKGLARPSQTAAGRDSDASGEPAAAAREPLSPEVAAALAEPPVRPFRELFSTLAVDGRGTLVALAGGLAVAAATTVVQMIFFRGLLDIGVKLVLPEQRLGAAAALLLFLAAKLLLEVPLITGSLGLGRRLDARLRLRFLRKIARLPDRYFRSRLASDMAERSHSAHMLRDVPEIGSALLRVSCTMVLTVAGIVWVDPSLAPIAVLAMAVNVGLPLAVQPVLAETDLRVRVHAGALSRFYLDSLLGLVPVRNHGAERAMRREHEGLVLEWSRSMFRSEGVKLWVDGAQAVAGTGLAAWLVFRHLAGSDGVGNVLLLAYWALSLQHLGEQLARVGRLVPHYRNVTRRLLEPLRMEEVEEAGEPAAAVAEDAADAAPRPGVASSLKDVRVVASGHVILDGVDLEIEAGSHIAIVGPSGAGKSTLLGLFLGWQEPAAGRFLVDGEVLDAGRLQVLRGETAWIDPAVQLWNRSLLANLRYGSRDEADDRIGGAVDAALLTGLMEKLPLGLQTTLGEGGALVSGGEGQRVRFARALLRPRARLVLLDEPFRGLDRAQRRELTGRARAWWRDATLLYVSHDIAETLDFDRVVVVESGKISETGRPADLAADPASRYASLLAAEEQVRSDFRSGATWRRLRLEGGRLVETKTPRRSHRFHRGGLGPATEAEHGGG